MNLVNFQDTKLIYRSLLHFYTLTTNYQKEKLRKQSHLPFTIKKNKISRNGTLFDINCRNNFFNPFPRLMEIKETNGT